jgi:hypothetical protein
MSSPFPGMDPYLEEPGFWPDVHHGLISEVRDILARQLRPKYYVRIEERVYLSGENDPGRIAIISDMRSGDSLMDDEIHEDRLQVINAERHQVVTVIEIASPTNKVAGWQGRASYLRKREEVMNSPSHFVEIDLLRAGDPLNFRELLPPHDYLVHVSIRQRRPRARAWPIRLQQRLPVVEIPLRPEDKDVPLDLQEVLSAVYDRAGYDMSINYHSEPNPPLCGENTEWAAKLLREKGLQG